MTYKDIKGIINSSGIPFTNVLNKAFDWIAGALGQNNPEEYTYEELLDLTRNHKIQVGKKYILKDYTTRLNDMDISNLSMLEDVDDTCYFDLLLTGKSSNDFEEDVKIKIRYDNKFLCDALLDWDSDLVKFNLQPFNIEKPKVNFYITHNSTSLTSPFKVQSKQCNVPYSTIQVVRASNNSLRVFSSTAFMLQMNDSSILTFSPFEIIVNIPKEYINVTEIYGKYNFRFSRGHTDILEKYPKAVCINPINLTNPIDCYIPSGNYKKDDNGNIIEEVFLPYEPDTYKYYITHNPNMQTSLIMDTGESFYPIGDINTINPQIGLLQNITIPSLNIDIDYDFFNIAINTMYGGSGSGSGSGSSLGSGSSIPTKAGYALTFVSSFSYKYEISKLPNNIHIKISSDNIFDFYPYNIYRLPFNIIMRESYYGNNINLKNSIFNIVYGDEYVELISSNNNIIGGEDNNDEGEKIYLINSHYCHISSLNNFYLDSCYQINCFDDANNDCYKNPIFDGYIKIYNSSSIDLHIPIANAIIKNTQFLQLKSLYDNTIYTQSLYRLNIDNVFYYSESNILCFKLPLAEAQRIAITMDIVSITAPALVNFDLSNIVDSKFKFEPLVLQPNTHDYVLGTNMLLSNGEWVKKSDYDEVVYKLISQTTQTNE